MQGVGKLALASIAWEVRDMLKQVDELGGGRGGRLFHLHGRHYLFRPSAEKSTPKPGARSSIESWSSCSA